MMTNENTEDLTWTEIIMKHFAIPIFVALVIGASSSYMTMKISVNDIENKLQAHEKRLDKQEKSVDKIKKQQNKFIKDFVEQLTRVETKIDLLMAGKKLENDGK